MPELSLQWKSDELDFSLTLTGLPPKSVVRARMAGRRDPVWSHWVEEHIVRKDCPHVEQIARHIEDRCATVDPRGRDAWLRVRAVLALVHEHITYLPDRGEYPQHPSETLVLRTGDCEDSAMLTAAVLWTLGVPCGLVFPGSHCAVGVPLPPEKPHWHQFQHEDDAYCYCECCRAEERPAPPLGHLDDTFRSPSYEIIPVPRLVRHEPIPGRETADAQLR